MGFMDKAKKMAEQAQAKIDEAQKQFNAGQQQQTGPAVEYDQHGRPIAADPAPPHGDPVAGSQAPPPPATPTPGVPPTGQGDPVMPPEADPPPPTQQGVPPTGDELPPTQPGVPPTADESPADDPPAEDRNHPSYTPPKLTGGDPLAG